MSRLFIYFIIFGLVGACASSQLKARKEQRDKAIQSSKLYCEFVNGEQYPDLDVALNLQLAQHCDSDKNFSITNYKTPSEISGIMFCCSASAKSLQSSKMESPVNKSGNKAKDSKNDKESDKNSDKNDGLE